MQMNNMRTIEVDKANLISILKGNRLKHEREFNEAVSVYPTKVAEALEALAKKIREKGKTDQNEIGEAYRSLPTPISYLSAYDQIIEMLEMDIEKTVVLNGQEYQHFVKDNWEWSHSFKTTVANYVGSGV